MTQLFTTKKFIFLFLLQLIVILATIFSTHAYLSSRQKQENIQLDNKVQRVLPVKNLMVYTKYTDSYFKSSTGHVFIAELHNPTSEQVVYDFREHEKQRLNRLIGVADKKVFYLVHYPFKNTLELGYIDLLTSDRKIIAQPKGYPDSNTVFFDESNKKVYYPAQGGLYVYDVASKKQTLLLSSDKDSVTEDDAYVIFADSQKVYISYIVHYGWNDNVSSVLDLKTKKVSKLDNTLISPVFSDDGKKVAYFEDSTPNKYPSQRLLKIEYLDETKILELYSFTYTGGGPIAPPTVVKNLAFSKGGNRFSFSVGTNNSSTNQYSYTNYVSQIEQFTIPTPKVKVTDSPQGARKITLLPDFNENTYKNLNKVEDIPHDYKWSMAYIPKGEIFGGSKQEAKIYSKDEITYIQLENAFSNYPLIIRARDILFISDP